MFTWLTRDPTHAAPTAAATLSVPAQRWKCWGAGPAVSTTCPPHFSWHRAAASWPLLEGCPSCTHPPPVPGFGEQQEPLGGCESRVVETAPHQGTGNQSQKLPSLSLSNQSCHFLSLVLYLDCNYTIPLRTGRMEKMGTCCGFGEGKINLEASPGCVFSWLYLFLGCSNCESRCGPEQRMCGPAAPCQLWADRAGPALQ